MEVSSGGNSLVTSTAYLIVISFQGAILRPNSSIQLNDPLSDRYPATHTGKGKKAQWLSVLLGDSKIFS